MDNDEFEDKDPLEEMDADEESADHLSSLGFHEVEGLDGLEPESDF